MADTPTQRLSLPPIAGRVLSVEFRREQDRFAHAILVSEDQQVVQRLDSLEGTGQDLWPPSPALQQLNIQQIANDRQAALMVGMAGKSHFSLSVTVEPESRQIVFDVACNYKMPPSFLGSTYRLAERGESIEQLDFKLDDRLPTRLVHDAASDTLEWLPDMDLSQPPALGRWCYCIGLRNL